ncbi:SDR family NAD(P)-dependent oxidoreductase [Streptomyces sp. 4N509B]|uniref:SDR family NAD(P)-dependent oxidoreductase n=1 Tax=Streptomyces sp. 4N509B TaxID=3457413 RepID=UPI003FCEF966
MLLSGKTALITGASRGIGAAAARAFASAGAAVALTARDADALERLASEVRDAGGEAVAVPADVTDEHAVAAAVRTVTERFGALHCAFNNAGGLGESPRPQAPLADTSVERFDAVTSLNLRGAFLCLRHEIPAMLASGGGSVVNTSSGSGLAGTGHGLTPYVAAKHGLQGLTKAAALEYAAQGVRVNAVAPGPILTEALAEAPREYQRAAAEAVPMRRVGLPEEVAAAAVWLCSDQSGFVTGATLPIDGGQLAGHS